MPNTWSSTTLERSELLLHAMPDASFAPFPSRDDSYRMVVVLAVWSLMVVSRRDSAPSHHHSQPENRSEGVNDRHLNYLGLMVWYGWWLQRRCERSARKNDDRAAYVCCFECICIYTYIFVLIAVSALIPSRHPRWWCVWAAANTEPVCSILCL